jgi:hypothetical protein
MRQMWTRRFVLAVTALLLVGVVVAGVAKSSTAGTGAITGTSAGVPTAPSLKLVPGGTVRQPAPALDPSSGAGTRMGIPVDDNGVVSALGDESDADQGNAG